MDLNNYLSESLDLRCKVSLQNRDLWKKFHDIETEMIITKSGRRMFPALRLQISNLDPNLTYCVFLEFVPVSDNRYKYSGGWSPSGSAELQSPHRIYLHPESPATGAHWMSQTVNFNRLKLTNSVVPQMGQVVLNSMHKYQPKVIIVQTANPQHVAWAPSTTFSTPETQFIAVTAYQNDEITKLKIDNNPFAKGFRENGQSRCKRKIKQKPMEEDSLPAKLICSSDESVASSPEPIITHPSPTNFVLPQNYHYSYPQNCCASWPGTTNPYMYKSLDYAYLTPQIPNMYLYTNLYTHNYQPQNLSRTQTPKKYTDFSIKAITET